MQSIADTAPHRARFAWLAAAFVASVVLFALSRPAHVRHYQRVGHCHQR
jgi:hypothetical protein